MVYTAFPGGKPVTFAILHHKMTSAIQFCVNTNTNPLKNQEVNFAVFRDLNNSTFCRTFLSYENLNNTTHDYQNKFLGVRRSYEKYVIPFFREKVELHIQDSNKPSLNYMIVFGWKLQDINDDLMFYLVQRKCFNNITKKHIIRTAGLQFATKSGLDVLSAYATNSDNSIKKVSKIPDFIMSDTADEEEI
jgi:hypothetical protein